MKKLLILLFSLLISFNSYGEKYTCAYLFDGEALPRSFERQGNYFLNGTIPSQILFEDKTIIVLTKTFPEEPPATFTTLINKEKLNFVFAALEYKTLTKNVEGTCSLTK